LESEKSTSILQTGLMMKFILANGLSRRPLPKIITIKIQLAGQNTTLPNLKRNIPEASIAAARLPEIIGRRVNRPVKADKLNPEDALKQ